MTDNRTEKRKTGDLGEKVACTFLVKHGYYIIETNYLRKYGEIDIVAQKGGEYYFIEVKSVSRVTNRSKVARETDTYRAEDNVHPWKIKRLQRVIQAYLLDKKICGEWKFGVITVELNMKTRLAKVNFLEDIVL